MSGIMCGKIASTLKKNTLPFAYLLVAISFFIAAIAPSFIMLLVAAFIFGYALMVFIPYIQDISSLNFPNHSGLITSTIFLTQGVGGFVSPYMGNIITSFTPLTSHQYMVGGVIFLIFVLVSPFVSRKK